MDNNNRKNINQDALRTLEVVKHAIIEMMTDLKNNFFHSSVNMTFIARLPDDEEICTLITEEKNLNELADLLRKLPKPTVIDRSSLNAIN